MFHNLHNHSYYSLRDSISSPKDIVEFCKKHNQTVCISDHGNLSCFIEAQKLARDTDLKCLMACEIYEVDDEYIKNNTKDNKEVRYHLLLIAKNDIGKKNLIQIVSHANTTGRYIKPRISLDTIELNEWGEGIICCTACMAGRLSRYLMDYKEDEALKFVLHLHDCFDEVYCEIQAHNVTDQAKANKLIYQFSQRHNFKYVITTDSHMISAKDSKYQAMLAEMSEDREVGETYTGCYMQTEEQVYRNLKTQFSRSVIEKGIAATCEIVNMCNQIDVGLDNSDQMPEITIPKEFLNSKDYLRHLVYETFEEKFGQMEFEDQVEREERIEMELPVLFELDYTEYFIMLYLLVREGRKREIPIGYSRGSGANCLCLYMLGVTQIDSVRWNLDFSRFANLGRKGSMADFDFDLSKRRRKEMIDISKNLFGEDKVANISTFNTLTNKVAIRDIGKVLNDKVDSPYYKKIPIDLRDKVAKAVPVIREIDEYGEEIERDLVLRDVINTSEELKKAYKEFPDWIDYAIHLAGIPKSRGCHASAVIISPKPILDYCSVCLSKDGEIMLEVDMASAMEYIKLIKMDYLGLKTLDIVDDCLKMSNITWDDVDINHLDLEDNMVYEEIYQKGNTISIFQMESEEAKNMCIKAQANNIEDIIVVNSANRPGTKDSFPDYCTNKLTNKKKIIHPDLETIFGQSQGVLLYQEQALQLLRYIGTFEENEIDNVRRAISKKDKMKMNKAKSKFIKGLKDKKWSEDNINEIWELLEKQSSYCFNRGHAVAYSLLSYLTAYLKVHYTVNFMTASLIGEIGEKKLPIVLDEIQKMGFELECPDINKSLPSFTPIEEENKILYGFSAIKGFSSNAEQIIAKNRPYVSFEEFLERDGLNINKKDNIALIKSGALNQISSLSKAEMLKEYFNLRFTNKKEQSKPITKINVTHIKSMLKEGLISPEMTEDRELCLKVLNEQRQKTAWKEFQESYLQGTEDEWLYETLNTRLGFDPFEGVVISDFSEINIDDYGHIGGEILSVKEVITKKGKSKGQKMAFINVQRENVKYDVVVFAQKYSEYKEILKAGKCVVMQLKKNGEFKGILNKCELLEDYKYKTGQGEYGEQ